MANEPTYLGVLAAPTAQGRRAVAVALTGGVELYHVVDAGFVSGSKAVDEWLLTAGIDPAEASSSLNAETLIAEILLPEIGNRTLVVCHADMDVSLVDSLVTALGRHGNPPIISGIELSGPMAAVTNGAAGRRAFSLQARYEMALDDAMSRPAEHRLDGTVDANGMLASMSVDGPFAKGSWTMEAEEDGLFVMLSLAGIASLATFVVKEGPAASALARLAAEVGFERRMAA